MKKSKPVKIGQDRQLNHPTDPWSLNEEVDVMEEANANVFDKITLDDTKGLCRILHFKIDSLFNT